MHILVQVSAQAEPEHGTQESAVTAAGQVWSGQDHERPLSFWIRFRQQGAQSLPGMEQHSLRAGDSQGRLLSNAVGNNHHMLHQGWLIRKHLTHQPLHHLLSAKAM